MDRDEEKGFEFIDKRKLRQDEALRDEQHMQEVRHEAVCHQHMHPSEEDAYATGGHTGHCGGEAHDGQCEHDVIAEVSFINFVANISTDVMVSLGLLQDHQGQTYKDMAVAKYLIDVIAMLQEKTKGNLDDSEAQHLSDMLYHLQMAYVNIANQP
ncbi:MAG: DUF1844 domain-containing protein [Nitrospirae bacterium]|uniref:DUF1844 domain-containing protein n=1 Tax=Candidatus Magnetobacterium casense TaxID=1455061 RepID=UPI00069776C8|nr:DUF1844 domain-containing protein [Candidatus Magnetobacterium casensis]MBF0338965.1 DUF1844 domain-containing protein [Nitrospirota bacterium]